MKKKIIFLLLSIFCLFGIYFGISYVKADSGWDSDYDSDWGSDWDSGSDWESSWDNDYDYDYDYDSGYGGGGRSYSYHSGGAGFIYMMIFAFVVICILDALTASKNKDASYHSTTNYVHEFHDVSKDVLDKYGIDAESFKEMVYKKYVEIQEAWSNFEYDKLRNLLTDELYNSYMMQLDTLKLKKQKNVMSDFVCVDNKITSINDENGIINVSIYLRIQMFDYVVDSANKVIRGTDKNKIDIQYIIKFVKKNNDKETICPNCGAKIKVITGGQCEYCKATVLVDPNDFVMSSKTNIGQRRI